MHITLTFFRVFPKYGLSTFYSGFRWLHQATFLHSMWNFAHSDGSLQNMVINSTSFFVSECSSTLMAMLTSHD